jgi:hypothetical protein
MQCAEWKQVHDQLCRLANAKAAYDADEAHWLVEGKRARVHEPLGYGSYFEYLERLFGYIATHVGRPARATQDIPPRTRRHVWRRDHGRCQVPGCRASKYLEIHHIVPRSRRGSHDPANLILVCNAHHVAVHEGRLTIEGTAPDHVTFTHADGTPYGHCEATSTDPASDAVVALRGLGFSSTDAQRAVADAPTSHTLEATLRHALATLRPNFSARCREPLAPYASGRARPNHGAGAGQPSSPGGGGGSSFSHGADAPRYSPRSNPEPAIAARCDGDSTSS